MRRFLKDDEIGTGIAYHRGDLVLTPDAAKAAMADALGIDVYVCGTRKNGKGW